MTLATTTNRVEYNGDASTTSFAFAFTVLLEGDLDVYVDGVLKTLTTDYTVGGTLPGTGTVDFVTAPASGTANVIIIRNVDPTQTLDLTATEFPPETVEQTFDKIVMMVQQINETFGRALKFATTSLFEDLDVPDPDVGKVLGWATGPVLANLAALPTSTVTVTSYMETLLDDADARTARATLVSGVKGADVASSGALTLGADGDYFDITGTTTITSIGTLGIGQVVTLHFDGALTLTHHATDLILPGAANITTAPGDEFTFVEYASGDWRCIGYALASGKSLVTGGGLVLLESVTPSAAATIDFTVGISSTYKSYLIVLSGLLPATDNVNLLFRVSTDGGSTFEAGASDYRYTAQGSADSAGAAQFAQSTGATSIGFLSANVGNQAPEGVSGRIEIFNPASTNHDTHILGNFIHVGISENVSQTQTAGKYNVTTAVDGFQILFSSGNVASGEARLYGLRA